MYALKVRTSQWTRSAEVPVPPWNIVVKSPLWSDSTFAGLREQLAWPLERPEVPSSSCILVAATHWQNFANARRVRGLYSCIVAGEE